MREHGVSQRNGVLRYLKIDGYAEMLSGFVDYYEPAHLRRIERELAHYGGSKRELEIPVANLNTYLLDRGLTTIDDGSIDTEGGEFGIVQSLDFQRLTVRLLSIENNYGDRTVRDYLRGQGYSLLRVLHTDDLFGLAGSVQGAAVRERTFRLVGGPGS